MEKVKIKDLDLIVEQRYLDGSQITFSLLREELETRLPEYGVPFEIAMGEVSYGLFDETVDALLITNPSHTNQYAKVVIMIKRQGNTCLVQVATTESSKKLNKAVQKGTLTLNQEEEMGWYHIIGYCMAQILQ